MKTVTAFRTDGTTTKLVVREDEHGNLWPLDCPDNRRALGVEPAFGCAMFGSCFVPDRGNEREASENSLAYYTGEGENFIVGEHPYAELASRLEAIRALVLVDSQYAEKVASAIGSI